MSMRARAACALGLALVAVPAALAQPAAGAAMPTSTVRDSAGVRIVTSTRPMLPTARAWRVDAMPLLRIGAGDPRTAGDTLYEFHLAMGVARLADGRWAVGVQGSNSVRFYDARGRHLKSAGRRGKGPGEFEQVMGVTMTRGDTLGISDLDGIEWYDGTGRFIRTGAGHGRSTTAEFVYAAGFLADGAHVGVQYDAPPTAAPPPSGRRLERLPVVVMSRDGNRITRVAVHGIRESVYDGKSRYGSRVVYGGLSHITAAGDRVFLAHPTDANVDVLGRDGRHLMSIRWPLARDAVTPAMRAAFRAHILGQRGHMGEAMVGEFRKRTERQLDAMTYAERLAAIGGLVAARDGTVWVQRSHHRQELRTAGPVRTETFDTPTTWDVFDAEGRWLTTLELPRRFTPQEIGADYVAGIVRNEDEEEGVLALRLVKP